MDPKEAFQDTIIELEQYKAFTATPSSQVLEQLDCAEVVERMVDLVVHEPAITQFYRSAMIRYRKTKPESVQDEATLIRDRVSLLEQLDVISPKQAQRSYEQLASGEMVYSEAKLFFRLFKSFIDPSMVPADRYRRRRRKNKPTNTQATDTLQAETVTDELIKPKPELTAVPIPEAPVVTESSDEVGSETKQPLGWEYDQLVDAYKNHPDNNLKRRFARDTKGFEVNALQPFLNTKAAVSGDEEALFIAYMNQFPLLDGSAHEVFLKQRVDAGKDASLALRQNTDIDRQERLRLEQLAIEGAGAFLTMYECNLRLVMSVANRYPTTPGYKTADAIQDGCLGLRRAIQKFDPEKGFKFSTYATAWIRQSITRRHSETFYDVRLPVGALQKAKEIRKLIENAKNAQEKLDDQALLDQGFTEAEIFAARHLTHRDRKSLDAPVSSGNDTSLQYFLKTPDVDFDGRTLREDQGIQLFADILHESGINDQRALLVLALRGGIVVPGVDYSQRITINGYEPASVGEFIMRVRSNELTITLDEVASVIGLTRERVRQIHEESSAALLRGTALAMISKRLHLDEDERKAINKYLQIKGFYSVGRPSEQKTNEAQSRAKNVIDLLHLLDADFEGAVSRTLTILEAEKNYSDKKQAISEKWLRIRFGLQEVDEIPLGTSQAQAYKVDVAKARIEEAIFLSVLTGTWGATPEKIGELNEEY